MHWTGARVRRGGAIAPNGRAPAREGGTGRDKPVPYDLGPTLVPDRRTRNRHGPPQGRPLRGSALRQQHLAEIRVCGVRDHGMLGGDGEIPIDPL